MPAPVLIESNSLRLAGLAGRDDMSSDWGVPVRVVETTGMSGLSGRGEPQDWGRHIFMQDTTGLGRLSGGRSEDKPVDWGVPIVITSSLAGLGSTAAEAGKAQTSTRKTVGIASLIGGGLLLAAGTRYKGTAKVASNVLGAGGVGYGAWLLLKGIDYPGRLPWETK